MFRATVHATEATDVNAAVIGLRAKCEKAGLTRTLTDLLTSQARQVLTELVERGMELAAMGSQMQVARELSGEGYTITILFQCGQQQTLLQRLLNRLR